MTAHGAASTCTEEVYGELRGDLISGQFEPGQRLKLTSLAERFGTSQSVVREALTRLSQQYLVVATPQRGFRVRELSVESLRDLTDVRVKVECLALEQSLTLGDMAWESELVACHHRLEQTPLHESDARLNVEWHVAHRAFHEALLAGCRSPLLMEITTSLREAKGR